MSETEIKPAEVDLKIDDLNASEGDAGPTFGNPQGVVAFAQIHTSPIDVGNVVGGKPQDV